MMKRGQIFLGAVVVLILGLVSAAGQPPLGQEPRGGPEPKRFGGLKRFGPKKLGEAEKQLAEVISQMEQFLDKVPTYSATVRTDWRATGVAAPVTGVNMYRLDYRKPDRFRIEVRSDNPRSP